MYILQLRPVEQGTTLPHTHPSGFELAVLQRWTHNYIVSNLVSHLDRIYIGDAVSSLSVIRWDDGAKKLFNVARDYAPFWPVSIEAIGPGKIIGCNARICICFLLSIYQLPCLRTTAICPYSTSTPQIKDLKWPEITILVILLTSLSEVYGLYLKA